MGPFPDRLVFTYREDELIAYSQIVSRLQDRGPAYSNFRAAMLVITLGIGFIVLLAHRLDWISLSELQPVLLTAYAAFFAGAFAYHGALHLGYRRIARTVSRSAEDANGPYEVAFDANGIAYKSAKVETRVPWDAIAEVYETRSIVLIWISLAERGLPIPTRVFSDSATRAAFITAIRGHASTAKASLSSGSA
jgi:hypothetical protein